MKFKEITQLSEDITDYVEKNKKLPKKISGLTVPEYSYVLTQSVINPGKSIEKLSFKPAPAPTGDSISKTLTRNEYTTLAKDVNKFINSNSRLPNYVVYQNKKINIDLAVYCFAKVIEFYGENNRLPNTCKFESNVFKNTKTSTVKEKVTQKLKAYLTTKGCSGMGQCTSYNCGPNSLQQCFYRLTGILVDETTIAKWAGTTTSGTDHQGLETAVAQFNKKYGTKIRITWKNFSDLGSNDSNRWKAIQSYINIGAVFCHLSYRNKWGHYEVPKSIGDNVTVLNSLGDKCTSTSYCGYIENRTKSTQLSYIRGISQKSIAILTI
jgi:hypothetical protein